MANHVHKISPSRMLRVGEGLSAHLILNRTGEPFFGRRSPITLETCRGFPWSSANANERGGHAKNRLDTSNERSLLGTSLAAETSFQQFFWNQRFKPGFLESVEAADTSVCATNLIPKVTLG